MDRALLAGGSGNGHWKCSWGPFENTNRVQVSWTEGCFKHVMGYPLSRPQKVNRIADLHNRFNRERFLYQIFFGSWILMIGWGNQVFSCWGYWKGPVENTSRVQVSGSEGCLKQKSMHFWLPLFSQKKRRSEKHLSVHHSFISLQSFLCINMQDPWVGNRIADLHIRLRR